MGTAQYLSPEQARGETVDARSDLYSAGSCSTSCSPAAHRSRATPRGHRLPARAGGPGAAVDVEPDLPPDLDAVVMKALAKNPDNRYQSAQEMRDDLERLLSGPTVLATPVLREPAPRPTPPPRPARERRPLLAAHDPAPVVLLLLAAGAVIGGPLLARNPTTTVATVSAAGARLNLTAAERTIRQNGLARRHDHGAGEPAKPACCRSTRPRAPADKESPVSLSLQRGAGPGVIPAVTGPRRRTPRNSQA